MKRLLRAFDVAAPVVLLGFGMFFALERRRPLRERRELVGPRLRVNGIETGLPSAVITRAIVLPAMLAASGRGPLSRLPRGVSFVASFLALDAAMYAWHRLNHGVPFLWRYHARHHLDRDLDVTTALRFVPQEVALSAPFMAAAVALSGASPAAVVAYELAMPTATLFHHSNWALPAAIDHGVRALFVTPRMHEIHHSIDREEGETNFSVVFSFWDRLFGSYRGAPKEGELKIGLPCEVTP